MSQRIRLGATYLGNGRCSFLVWAPLVSTVEITLVSRRNKKVVAMEQATHGYHHAVVEGVNPGAHYFYRLDGQKERPDPASRYQPDGVHGPSQVVDPATFTWQDQHWFGRPLQDLVIYELHVGTFSPEGTFDAIIPYLDELRDLGITAIELMPVAQFPGGRNWGYDGVQPFAVQHSYGGPEGLRRLVNACHLRGLAVVLDVVYNHLGPEGNYFADFAPFFTDAYLTPWGKAINFDGPDSDDVRRFFVENATHWFAEFHVDALRLDAIHAIKDFSATPFLQELATATHSLAERLNRRLHLIAESDLNDARVIRSPEIGGLGLDAQWSDDFHHALHSLLTGERAGYYQDFGGVGHLARAFREAFVYSGQYSPFRRCRHGNSPRLNSARQFVVCSQNHDQTGNRMLGERLSQLVAFESLKLAAGAVLLSPFVPLLFMGEEYGETAPFQYFTSHSDRALIEAVRKGRREEFATFNWQGEVPDPQAETTFLRSKLRHHLRRDGHHRALWEFYRELIRLRAALPPLAHLSLESIDVASDEETKTLFVRRWTQQDQVFMLFNFGDGEAVVPVRVQPGQWRKEMDSSEQRWLGGGSLLPQQLSLEAQAQGEMTLTIQRRAFVVFSREDAS
ncbi:MAG: malto-oligosyltrehalose trehalohydrolase [Chloroflexi bacterium]|nr:malto-oligosyltrehalose trehalohydrolase [Chloroflexota bacterium]